MSEAGRDFWKATILTLSLTGLGYIASGWLAGVVCLFLAGCLSLILWTPLGKWLSFHSEGERIDARDQGGGSAHIQADPVEQIFVNTGGKRMVDGEWVAIGFRVISIPLFNGSEHGASDVKALVEVYPESERAGVVDGWVPPGVVFSGSDPSVPRPTGGGIHLPADPDGCLDRSHGRWRETGKPSRHEFEAGLSRGLARGIDFPPDRQRHLLDVLGQERARTRVFPGWQIVRYPVEATTSGAPLQEGAYRLEITLRSPDFEPPAKLNYYLEIPPIGTNEGSATAPRLTKIEV